MINTGAETSKLFQLRAKTDRQLLALIHARVDAGLQMVDRHAAEARKIYEEGHTLLPLVYDLTRAERKLLELKLCQLRENFTDISSHAELKMQTACS